VRRIQAETAASTAFIRGRSSARIHRSAAWSGGSDWRRIPETLAISRLYLDDVLNVQSSWVTQGFGRLARSVCASPANDVGSIMNRGECRFRGRRAPHSERRGVAPHHPRRGLHPKQRDTLYRTYFLN